MSAAIYEEILTGFREAYAQFEWTKTYFHFRAIRKECLREEFKEVADILGFVPVKPHGFYISSPRFDSWGKLSLEEPREVFEDLAGRAGAHLPQPIRDSLIEPVGSVSWWLALLWSLNPPSLEEYVSNRQGIVFICEPFLVSANAIELCKLNTDEPCWPNTTASREGNGQTEVDEVDIVEHALSGQQLKLYLFLRDRKYWTSYDTLAKQETPWRKSDPNDGTVKRSLDRLQASLNEITSPVSLVIEHQSRRTKLDKPTDK